jgi:hypothetical protein
MRLFKTRAHERVLHLREVSVHAPESGRTAVAYAIDLSRGGIKISTELPLMMGDAVELAWGDRDPAVTLGGRVIYVKYHDSGLFAGVRFHRPLGAAEFRGLREYRPATAGDGRGERGRRETA